MERLMTLRRELARAKGFLIYWFLLLLVFASFAVRADTSLHPNFVSFVIILDQPGYFEELKGWLDDVDFHNFTFAVWSESWYGKNLSDYWLLNSTRLNTLKDYGVLIPQTFWMQQYEPLERQAIIDNIIDDWENIVGYAPKGIFDFQPDTYTLNYCETRGIEYVVGYCFDQYAVDWMTERGGWQLPYYASHVHALVPNNVTSHGMVVLPHEVWDWVSSFTVTHNLHTHPLSLIGSIFGGNATQAENYFLDLIDRSLEAEPFGFATMQFEWVWHCKYGVQNSVKDWIKTLLSARNYEFWSCEDFTRWFKKEYETTPNYSINFRSPYDGQEIEWYYCQDFRIARIGDKVTSYVEYNKQKPDKFLTTTFAPNTSLSPNIVENSIDDSLSFEINGLGGGECRSPILDSGTTYTGELSEFPLQYVPEMPSLIAPLTVLSIWMTLSFHISRKKNKRKGC
jgi:hypothetical protein